MGSLNRHNLTNSFLEVRPVCQEFWWPANDILPRDHGGPSITTQDGCDPDDLKMIGDEFMLGRSRKWLSPGLSFRLSGADRRTEYVFSPETDETTAAYSLGRSKSGAAKT